MTNWKTAAIAQLEGTIAQLKSDEISSFTELSDYLGERIFKLQAAYADDTALWVDGEPISSAELDQILDQVMLANTDLDSLLMTISTNQEPIEFTTTVARAFIIVSQLQLALRHPNNNGGSSEITYQVAQNLSRAICSIVPEAEPLIKAGWQKHQDMSREEFRRMMSGATLTEEEAASDRAGESSRFLIDYAEYLGTPLFLIGHREMPMGTIANLEQKDPDRDNVQIEDTPINGFTFSWHCDGEAAQKVIDAIMETLRGMGRE